MKKKIICLCMCGVICVSVVACGKEVAPQTSVEATESSVETKVEEIEPEINENILAVAEKDSQYDEVMEMASNRLILDAKFFPDSKVPIPDSCVTGMVEYRYLEDINSYVYQFGSGSDVNDKDVYLSGMCAYAAHLLRQGLTYEVGDDGVGTIYDGTKEVAIFMVAKTDDDGYVFFLTAE